MAKQPQGQYLTVSQILSTLKKTSSAPRVNHAFLQDPKTLRGLDLTKEAVEAVGIGAGFRVRVTKIDGRPQVVTRDYNTNRLNIHVENGIVVDAYVG